MSVKSLETLETWCKARDFALRVYREALPCLPPEEKWNLNQQLRRSANSVPANIAEGYGRFYYQDNIRFCYNARGSLEETLNQLINGYIGYLKLSKQGQTEPGAQYAVRDDSAFYSVEAPSELNPE